jgi:hypothetical protein
VSAPREDLFRLPPLNRAEALMLGVVAGEAMRSPLWAGMAKKLNALAMQVLAHETVGKRVKPAKVDPYDPNVQGSVVAVMTAEEAYERDWEDMTDFDESRRGTMLFSVRWDATDASEGEPFIEDGYRREDLVVIDLDLPPDAELTVLGFAKSARLFIGAPGVEPEPVIVSIDTHPKNGWLFKVRDSQVEEGLGPVEHIQLTDNECNEAGGLTTRHVTPRG